MLPKSGAGLKMHLAGRLLCEAAANSPVSLGVIVVPPFCLFSFSFSLGVLARHLAVFCNPCQVVKRSAVPRNDAS